MELSKRLKAVAGLVTEGASVADIGTDHGYVPIWLIQSGKASRVIAMDVNEGPLERARGHIRSKRLENVIFTRKSDGLQALHTGEADTMIAAGMGGGLVHGEEAPYSQEELYYGRLLLKKKNPVLYRFLQREHTLKKRIADRLADQTGKGAESRRKELQDELERIEHAIASYEM